MKNNKVPGSGCTNCTTTLKLIDEAAEKAGTEIELENVADIGDIMSYGVMSTPGMVIDGSVVHAPVYLIEKQSKAGLQNNYHNTLEKS